MRLQDAPQVTGTVLDVQTQQPIAGAKLYYERHPKRVVYSLDDGRFDFPPIFTWQMVPLLSHRFYNLSLIAQKDGYSSSQRDFAVFLDKVHLVTSEEEGDAPLQSEHGLGETITNQTFFLHRE